MPVFRWRDAPLDSTIYETPWSTLTTRPGSLGDAWLLMEESRLVESPRGPAASPVLAYCARAGAEAPTHDVVHDIVVPSETGFHALFESPRAAAALLRLAASRAVDVGPESERAFVVLSGTGLVFLANDTMNVKAGDVAVVAPGDAARVWSRGPEPLDVLVLQPTMPREGKRTLASELAKRGKLNAG